LRRGDDLDCDVTLQFLVARAVDGAHAALADLFEDPELRKLLHGHSSSFGIVAMPNETFT
jgi:hypothetical protein